MYRHSLVPFTLDFPPGPLAIGNNEDVEVNILKRGPQSLRIISPAASVCDRLACYLHYRDYGGMEQALGVYRAQAGVIDLEAIAKWCDGEGHSGPATFRAFKSRL